MHTPAAPTRPVSMHAIALEVAHAQQKLNRAHDTVQHLIAWSDGTIPPVPCSLDDTTPDVPEQPSLRYVLEAIETLHAGLVTLDADVNHLRDRWYPAVHVPLAPDDVARACARITR